MEQGADNVSCPGKLMMSKGSLNLSMPFQMNSTISIAFFTLWVVVSVLELCDFALVSVPEKKTSSIFPLRGVVGLSIGGVVGLNIARF